MSREVECYRVAGVIEVDICASSPEEAQRLAEDRLFAILDRNAKRLRANIGMDSATVRPSALPTPSE